MPVDPAQPLDVTPEMLSGGVVRFDTAIRSLRGVVHKVFDREGTPKFRHQNVSIRVGTTGERILVRFNDREPPLERALEGRTIEIQSGVGAPRSVFWESTRPGFASRPSAGRVVVRKSATYRCFDGAAVVNTVPITSRPIEAPASMRGGPVGLPASDLETAMASCLQRAHRFVHSCATGSLAYLIANDTARAFAVTQVAMRFFDAGHESGSGEGSTESATIPNEPNRVALSALVSEKPDSAAAIEMIARFRGFLQQHEDWTHLSEQAAAEVLSALKPAA